MGALTAEAFGRACGFGAAHLSAVEQVEGLDTRQWLEWGSRWMTNPEARVDYEKALQDTIEEERRLRRRAEARVVELENG